jgi:hypothetical protein
MFGSAGIGWAIAVGAAAIGLVSSCEPDGSVTVGTHYLMDEGVAFEGDLVHGDRLDLIMVEDGGELARCDHYGGVLEVQVLDVIDEAGQAPRVVCVRVAF